MVNATVVALVAKSARLDQAPLGSGVLVAPDVTQVGAKASTHVSAKWQWVAEELGRGTHLIRLSYGRDGTSPLPSAELLGQAVADTKQLYGAADLEVFASHMQHWPASMIQARSGHHQLQQSIAQAVGNRNDLVLAGSGLGGNGITGILAHAKTQLDRMGI